MSVVTPAIAETSYVLDRQLNWPTAWFLLLSFAVLVGVTGELVLHHVDQSGSSLSVFEMALRSSSSPLLHLIVDAPVAKMGAV